MVRRFPLYTDADVKGALIEALRQGGWDVVRAIDTFPDGTGDEVHFDYAAKQDRVLVPQNPGRSIGANRWLRKETRFRGVVTWPQEHYKKMTIGYIVSKFEQLADEDVPFRYPIRHIHPPT